MKLENFKQTMKKYFEYMEACDRDGMLSLFAENAQIQVATLVPYFLITSMLVTHFVYWKSHQHLKSVNITNVPIFYNILKDPPGVRGLGPPSKDAKPMTKQECGELWDHIFKEPRKTTGAMISAISSTVPNQYCGLIEGGFLIEVYSLIGP